MDGLDIKMSIYDTLEMLFHDCRRNNPRDPKNLPAVPFILGPPGGGKTKVLEWKTEKVGWAVLTAHLSTKTLEEMTGLPQFHKITIDGKQLDGTRWTFPEMITELKELSETHEGVVLFLDDFHLASPENQKYCFELFTDYSLKGYDLPLNAHIMLAGNPGARAGAKTMLSAITNRVAFYNVYQDFNDWKKWAMRNNINQTIISFLSREAKVKYFHEEENSKMPWASPRSWHKLSIALDSSIERTNGNLGDDELVFRTTGHVGTEASQEYIAHYRLYSEVDVDAVFDHEKYKVPADSSNLFVYTMAMAYEYVDRFLANTNPKKDTDNGNAKRKKKLIDIMARLSSEVAKVEKDMAIVMLKEVAEMANVYTPDMIVDVLDAIDAKDKKLFESVIKMTRAVKST